METYERLRHFRKSLNLSQSAFGEKLGVSRDVINNIELNRLAKPEQKEPLYKLVCKTFGLSEEWLRNGTGDMFVQLSKEDEIAQFVEDLINCEDDSFKKRFVSALSVLDESEWEVLEKIANNLVKHKELIPFSGKNLKNLNNQY